MFHAFYFADKPVSVKTIIQDRNNPLMYFCLLLSFGCSLFINYIIGYFNKEQIKKITTIEEDKE